jgi:hypothetical protein
VSDQVKVNGPNNEKDLNIFSLVKRIILTFRHEPINEELLRHHAGTELMTSTLSHSEDLHNKNLRMLKKDIFVKK